MEQRWVDNGVRKPKYWGLGEPFSVQLYQPQISHGLAQHETEAFAVRGQ